jgi:Eukaryotic aspartyl protease
LISISLTTDFFWEAIVSGFGVGASGSLTSSSSNNYAISAAEFIFDTGTTLFYAPSSVATKINTLLTSSVYYFYESGYYYVRCSSASSMPSA